MRTVLGITALFAVLFAVIRCSGHPPVVPVFYAVFVILISMAQMVFERAPRLASIVTGTMYVPVCFAVEPMIRDHFRFSQLGEHFLMLALVGGFLAYLGGTVLAGVFLVTWTGAFGRSGCVTTKDR